MLRGVSLSKRYAAWRLSSIACAKHHLIYGRIDWGSMI